MGYFRDIDEFTTVELLEELARRMRDSDAGLCDYCHRARSAPPCKFPQRHTQSFIDNVEEALG